MSTVTSSVFFFFLELKKKSMQTVFGQVFYPLNPVALLSKSHGLMKCSFILIKTFYTEKT